MSKILVFGENLNDSRALRELIYALCPHLAPGDVRILREPPTLNRGASAQKVASWAEKAASSANAAKVQMKQVVCVIAHTDADGSQSGSFEVDRTRELRAAGLLEAHAIVPERSIEAWWLLFPEATEAVVAAWKGALHRKPGNVDLVEDPKAELRRRTKQRARKRPYAESDSPAIAAEIARRGASKPAGLSASFNRFQSTVSDCCTAAAA